MRKKSIVLILGSLLFICSLAGTASALQYTAVIKPFSDAGSFHDKHQLIVIFSSPDELQKVFEAVHPVDVQWSDKGQESLQIVATDSLQVANLKDIPFENITEETISNTSLISVDPGQSITVGINDSLVISGSGTPITWVVNIEPVATPEASTLLLLGAGLLGLVGLKRRQKKRS